jgi:hypothetical protein
MKWLFLILFAIPVVHASETWIDISLGASDLVKEDVTILVDEPYDTVSFTSRFKPIDVSFDGNYSIVNQDDYYILIFPAKEKVEFGILYEDFLERHLDQRIFRSSFYIEQSKHLNVRVILPPHSILSEREPSILPRPDNMTTDGRSIMLSWQLKEDTDISVFYTKEHGMRWYIVGGCAGLAVLALVLFLYFRSMAHRRVHDTLSSEEQKVYTEVRNERRQDHVAKSLGFSKSKMSKVVRKLEEKGLITKTPHFKTNKIRRK